MIAMLRGELVDRDGNRAVVDVQGVGYEVFAPERHLARWQEQAGEIRVLVSTQVREDAITLYGFAGAEEKKAFDTLLGVAGVGPKVALHTLDALELTELVQAVESNDVRALTRIPGVGKKTAQRMALELKGKLSAVGFTPSAARTPVKKGPADPLPLALARLGYTKTEIDRARAGLAAQGIEASAPVSDRLRAALQILSGR